MLLRRFVSNTCCRHSSRCFTCPQISRITVIALSAFSCVNKHWEEQHTCRPSWQLQYKARLQVIPHMSWPLPGTMQSKNQHSPTMLHLANHQRFPDCHVEPILYIYVYINTYIHTYISVCIYIYIFRTKKDEHTKKHSNDLWTQLFRRSVRSSRCGFTGCWHTWEQIGSSLHMYRAFPFVHTIWTWKVRPVFADLWGHVSDSCC